MSSQGIEGWIFSRPYQKDSHGGDSLLFDVSLDGNLPFGNTDDSSYQHYELSIQPGDWLLLYTDALTEAFNDRDEQLGDGDCYSVAWVNPNPIRNYLRRGRSQGFLNWAKRGNTPLSQKEFDAIRWSVKRGSPFGTESWVESTARRLDLESTLRPCGRPRARQSQNNDSWHLCSGPILETGEFSRNSPPNFSNNRTREFTKAPVPPLGKNTPHWHSIQ